MRFIEQADSALHIIRKSANLPKQVYQANSHGVTQHQTLESSTNAYLRAQGKEAHKGHLDSRHKTHTEGFKLVIEKIQMQYALDLDGHLVKADDAFHDADYHCPGCKAELTLKMGPMRAYHFEHKSLIECDSDMLFHSTAKLLISQIINQYVTSKIKICLQCTCDTCDDHFEKILPKSSFTTAEIEGEIEGFSFDVLAFHDGNPNLGIEILKANETVQGKTVNLPWISLQAQDVINQPYLWRPIQSRLNKISCAHCKVIRSTHEGKQLHRKLPEVHSDYVAARAPCWKCDETISWYWWPGVPFAKVKPPLPMPNTIKYLFSKRYGGKYWMNTCPFCHSSQGDNFVFLAEDSPFKSLPFVESESMKAERLNFTNSDYIRFLIRNL